MWVAYIVLAMIATGDAAVTSGSEPFRDAEACMDYLKEVHATINAANATKPDDQQMTMMGECVPKDIATPADDQSRPSLPPLR